MEADDSPRLLRSYLDWLGDILGGDEAAWPFCWDTFDRLELLSLLNCVPESFGEDMQMMLGIEPGWKRRPHISFSTPTRAVFKIL
jgi:hypothetical protein